MKEKKQSKRYSSKLEELTVFLGPVDYYDDCPVCQYLKKVDAGLVEFSPEEYVKALEEAESQGAVTGVVCFDPFGKVK